MNILMITQHYRPEPNFVTADLAETLASDSNRVTVITAHPNYPLGKFYDSVASIWPRKELSDSLTVWRLPLYPSHTRSKWQRLLNYGSFGALATVISPFLCWRPRVVVIYQTPFTTALAALFFKLVFRSQLIFICSDLWPESFEASGIQAPKLLTKLLFAYSRWINRWADQLICTTRGMQRRYIADGYPEAQTVYIPLWVDGSGGAVSPRTDRDKKRLRAVYIGNLGAAQDVGTVVLAAQILQDREVDIDIDIYGSGVEEVHLRQQACDLNLKNLRFFGRVPPSEAFGLASSSDVQIIHLTPSPLFSMTVPSKLAFSLSAGSPVVAGVIGESAAIIKEARCGAVVPPQNAQAMADALEKIRIASREEREILGASARQYYEANFCKKRLIKRWVSAITVEHN